MITIETGKAELLAVPQPTLKGKIAGAISTLFSTHYAIYASADHVGPPLSHVTYYPLKDDILIQVGEEKWGTHSTEYGPSKITYNDVEYTIYEKLTGKFFITQYEALIAEGHTHFRSVIVDKYPPKLEDFMVNLSVAILVRLLLSPLSF